MARFSKITGLVFMMMLAAGTVFAAWDSKDIDKIVQKIKAGESFTDSGMYPDEGIQQVGFRTNSAYYLIDVKAKLCFATLNGDGTVLIPCKAIKDGYPLFAPIITWEK